MEAISRRLVDVLRIAPRREPVLFHTDLSKAEHG